MGNRWVISWLVIDYIQYSMSNRWIIDRPQNFQSSISHCLVIGIILQVLKPYQIANKETKTSLTDTSFIYSCYSTTAASEGPEVSSVQCTHANSPGYGTDLLFSRTGHPISQIKSSFDLFCSLVWDVAHFFRKIWIFLFVVRFLAHFRKYLVTDKDYFGIKPMIVNFDSMYFM